MAQQPGQQPSASPVGRPPPTARGLAGVLLDRDGVINEPALDPVDGRHESPLHADQARLVPGAATALGRLHDAGLTLVVVSNQPAAAKGKTTCDELRAVHERIVTLLAEQSVAIGDWRYCPHHPDGIVAELSGACSCRKPALGMLQDAIAAHGLDPVRTWMVGDSDTDIEAGAAAGCRTLLVEHPGSRHRRGRAVPHARAADLSAAAKIILRTVPRNQPDNESESY